MNAALKHQDGALRGLVNSYQGLSAQQVNQKLNVLNLTKKEKTALVFRIQKIKRLEEELLLTGQLSLAKQKELAVSQKEASQILSEISDKKAKNKGMAMA
jgi:DNA-binding helix-hairpin-helix protein with protein kinase domain